MKLAYFGFPHLGGTFQVFRHLRAGLASCGIEVQWVGLGEGAHRALGDPAWSSEMAQGFVVGSPRGSDEVWARQLIGALKLARFDGIFVNVLADAVQTNVVRYLPAGMLRVLIVHSITPATYSAACAVRGHVHAAVAISPRIHDDLVGRCRFPAERVFLIPHAAEAEGGRALAESDPQGPLRLLYLGRIEDRSKGVSLLPAVLERLPRSVTLTIAGDGPDLPALRGRCRHLAERVRFLGPVPPGDVGRLLSGHHALLVPSRFEGFGLTVVEAMAAGCVPVASRIHGVTDWIVRDGEDGLLFPVGSAGRAADCIALLERDRSLLLALSGAARRSARHAFPRTAMVEGYRRLLEGIRAEPPSVDAPLDLAAWRMPKGLRDGLRSRLPQPVKNFVRQLVENRVQ